MFFESFLAFGLYFLTAVLLVVLFLFLYAMVTPYDDYQLIFGENNSAAAVGLGGAVVGLSLPLYSALSYSVSYEDFLVWGGVAMAIQLIFALVMTRIGGKYSFKAHIPRGNLPAGILMALLSVAIGLLNAGSLSY